MLKLVLRGERSVNGSVKGWRWLQKTNESLPRPIVLQTSIVFARPKPVGASARIGSGAATSEPVELFRHTHHLSDEGSLRCARGSLVGDMSC